MSEVYALAEQNLTKRCSLCHWYLPLSCFHKYRDGLRPECKECRKLVTRADYQKRKPKIREYAKRYQQQNKERLAAKSKRWRETNAVSLKAKKSAYAKRPDVAAKMVERNRARRHANPERANGYSAKWRKNNPEKRRASSKQNKAKRKQVVGSCSMTQWIAKCEYFGWRCYLCRIALTPDITHMDHRKPLSRGGTHWPANLAPACKSCNLSKSNKTEAEYRTLLNRFENVPQLITAGSS